MLDYDQIAAGLFEDGHEPEYRKGSANLYALKSAVQPAQDGGAVGADVKDLIRKAFLC